MFDFGRIVSVISEELGESGTEAISCAVEHALMYGKEGDFGCDDDVAILYMLCRAFDSYGFLPSSTVPGRNYFDLQFLKIYSNPESN